MTEIKITDIPPAQDFTESDGLVYRHVINVHGGASFMACPYCRKHIYEERKGIIPIPRPAQ
jgi:hypothetical protein